MSPYSGQELFNEQSQESPTDYSQVEVVNHEWHIELQSRELLHDLAATEDDDIVGDKGSGSLLESGHGGSPFNEFPLACRITHHLLEGLVEDGP